MSSLNRVVQVLAAVGGIVILLCLFYVFQVGRRMKGEIRFRSKLVAVALVLYGLSCAILQNLGYTFWETLAFSFLLGLTPRVFMKAPKRSRYIPARVRREVIARDLKGQPFDPRTFHLDHTVPVASTGDHSVQNLRVVPKGYNLSKGARWPGLRDLLGYKPKLHRESGSPSDGTVSGQEPERTPRRLRFVVRIMLVAAILGFCWHLAKNQKPRANNEVPLLAGTIPAAPVAPTAAVTAIGATGQPEVSSATPTPLALPPSPADAGKEVAGGEAPQGTLPPPPQDSAPQPGAALPPGTSPSGKLVAPPEPEARTYTTSELFAMYKADKHKTDRALKGSRIQVTGTLKKIGKDEVSLRESGDTDSVSCRFDTREALIHGRFSLGVVVTLRGNVTGRGLTGNVHLASCELVNPKESTTPED